MSNIQFISTYLTWIGLSLDFCTAFLTTLWLYRIWQHTRESAHLFLWLGLGVIYFLRIAISVSIQLFLPQNNLSIISVVTFLFSFCHLSALAAILIGLLLLEKDRVPRRQFIPEKLRNKLASNPPGGSPSSLSLVQKIAAIVLLIIAAAIAYSLIRAFNPHTALWQIVVRSMTSLVGGVFVCFWLFRLWQLTHDKAHLWLMAALLAGRAYGLIAFYIMRAFTPPGLSMGNSMFYDLNQVFVTRVLDLICAVMALRTMAGGAVTFREAFFPGVKEAEDS